MIVIKLGGSLSRTEALVDCLNAVEKNYQGRVVIVPGGGAFADQVRLAQQHWKFDDHTAHRMALLAMQQMALLFKGLKPDFVLGHSLAAIQDVLSRKKIVIWSPDIDELDSADIAASWDISSDSLSVWLAKALSATTLILVKSAAIDASLNLGQLAALQLVDKGFCAAVTQAGFEIQIISSQGFSVSANG